MYWIMKLNTLKCIISLVSEAEISLANAIKFVYQQMPPILDFEICWNKGAFLTSCQTVVLSCMFKM